MFRIRKFLRWLSMSALEQPKHAWVSASAKSREDCLRKLEDRADLPHQSLHIDEETRSIRCSVHHYSSHQLNIIFSRRNPVDSEEILEVSGYVKVFGDALNPFEIEGNYCEGEIEVRRNCTGFFRKGVCIACGTPYGGD